MPKRRKNPVPLSDNAKISRAIDLFQRFRGEDPEFVDTVELPEHNVCILIGDCDGILYTTIRDGKKESYIHEFTGKSRPQLIVSHDGKQLYLIGGSYDFTDEGIVDRA